MPYKDPDKAREMNRIYWKKYFATPKGAATKARAVRAWEDRNREHVREKGRERSARYLASEKGQATVRAQKERYQADGKAAAHAAVKAAILAGVLFRQSCAVCGAERANAHHHLGYAPEHQLDVEWLCARHHSAAHRQAVANG